MCICCVHVLVPCSDVISVQAVSVLFQDVLIVICGYSCVKYSNKFSLSLNRHQNQQFHHTDENYFSNVLKCKDVQWKVCR